MSSKASNNFPGISHLYNFFFILVLPLLSSKSEMKRQESKLKRHTALHCHFENDFLFSKEYHSKSTCCSRF